MLSRNAARSAAAGLFALALAGPAVADVTLTVQVNGTQHAMYLTEDKMCVEDGDDVMIFDATNETVTMVDAGEGVRRVMDRAQMEQMGAMMKGLGTGGENDPLAMMREQMMAAIEQLPEEQRAAALKELNARMPSPDAAAVTVEPTGETRKINGWNTRGVEIRSASGGGLMWVADLDEVGLKKGDLVVLGKLRGFIQSVMGDSPMAMKILKEFESLDPSSPDFVGFPVKQEGDQEMELVSVDRGSVDPAVFNAGAELPAKPIMEMN